MTNSKKQIVALLPMKANSERVKGKNFRNFNGKPLFKWILDTLLSVEEIDTVIINTDARDILSNNGLIDSERVMIRDRKAEICGDEISMNLILADDIENIPADLYLMTHTTNPLMSAETIRKSIKLFEESERSENTDSVFTVDKIQTRFYQENGKPVNHDPDNLIPTQDLEPWYEENSNLYLFTKNSFNKTNARIGAKPKMIVSPAFESIDIDTPDDWDFALVASKYLQEQQENKR
ncbi:MAG: acylneuraminate cytidylyltransferase family protein [Cocleimonas sp.]